MGLKNWWNKYRKRNYSSSREGIDQTTDEDGIVTQSRGGHYSTGTFKTDMDNARKGIVYLFAHVEPRSKLVDELLSCTRDVFKYSEFDKFGTEQIFGSSDQGTSVSFSTNSGISGHVGSKVRESAFKTITKVSEKTGAIIYHAGEDAKAEGSNVFWQIVHWLQDFLKTILSKLKAMFGEPKIWVTIGKEFILAIAKEIWSNASEQISQGKNVVKGLWNAGKAVVQKVGHYWASGGVELIEGHPSLICGQIQTALSRSLMEGLYVMIRGAVNMALVGTGIGAGLYMVVNLITTGLEMLVRFALRIWEMSQIKTWINWCKEAWAERAAPGAPHKDAEYFNESFGNLGVKVPIISAVALTSNICGDKMRFLKMFEVGGDGRNAYITQSAFDAGVRHVDGLKLSAARYQEAAGYSFKSGDPIIKALLDKGKKLAQDADSRSTSGKIFRAVDMVATV